VTFDPYDSFGPLPDVVHDVQADLVAEWLDRPGGVPADPVELFPAMSADLLLPATQLCTVVRRMADAGRLAAWLTEAATAYLIHTKAKHRDTNGGRSFSPRPADQANAERYRQKKGRPKKVY
jgi:hypothetical protein